jgi:heptosyltransferase-2
MTLPLNRLLAVELADIGDLILTTPALGALRETFPSAKIDLLTTGHAAPIVQGTGLIDEVILFNKFAFDRPTDLIRPANLLEGLKLARKLRAGQYDAVLIFHHLTTPFGAAKYAGLALATGAPIRAGLNNGRGWFLTHRVKDEGFGVKHQADYWLELVGLLGATSADKRLRVGISNADREWAQHELSTVLANNAEVTVIHSGSGGYSLARRWEPEKFAAVADSLAKRGSIIFVGSLSDDVDGVLQHMKTTPINLTGKTTLDQLAAVLSLSTRYIGADSGVMHLSSAAQPSLKTVEGVFGPSNHEAWGPYKAANQDAPEVTVVRSGVLCSPCSYVGHTVGLRNGCEARTCMKLVQPDHISSVDSDKAASLHAAQVRRALTSKSRKVPLRILGVPVDKITFDGLLDQIGKWIAEPDATRVPRQICTVNPEFLMTAQKDINFYNILNRCDLCAADGVGLLWAAKRLGHPLPERVTGSDGVPLIAERAAKQGWRLFLLGAGPGVAEKTAQILTERYPGLQIAGIYEGTHAAQDEDHIAEIVAASGADILFVAYGAPAQDKWIARNLPRLNVNVAMGVGGSFDFIAGVTQRAPLWMRRAGIEWLHRLIKQPWRFRRMMRLPLFVLTVLRRGSRGPVAFVGRNNTGRFV